MTRGVHHIDAVPDIIPARVNIHHLQLRDLLQPTGVKDNVLFVSRLQVEHADFSNPLKPPSVYCTLDFQPIASPPVRACLPQVGSMESSLCARCIRRPCSVSIRRAPNAPCTLAASNTHGRLHQ